jgi:hypothetical protein
METAVVLTSMPGGVGGQRREPLPTRLETIHTSESKQRSCEINLFHWLKNFNTGITCTRLILCRPDGAHKTPWRFWLQR